MSNHLNPFCGGWKVGIPFLVSVGLMGCAGVFRSQKPLSVIDPDLLIHQLHQHASKVKTFEGKARITVATPAGYFRGSIKIAVRTPDSLWMKIEGPFGVDVMTARLGGGEFLLYSPWSEMVYQGPAQKTPLMDVLPIDLDTTDLILGILGLLVPGEAVDSLWCLSIEEGRYVLDFQSGEKVWIAPEGPVVTRWEKRNPEGKIMWVWEGKRFKGNAGIRFPHFIRVTLNHPKERYTFFFDKVKANRPMRSGWCQISIPEGVESIEL